MKHFSESTGIQLAPANVQTNGTGGPLLRSLSTGTNNIIVNSGGSISATGTGLISATSIPTLNNESTAYVESSGSDLTGSIGKPYLPFSTINAALDALPSTGGVIHIGIGVFSPIQSDYNISDIGVINPTTKLKPNVKFVGSGTPVSNSARTALIGGTSIKGPIWVNGALGSARDGISFENLGVDSGSAVCTELYSGVGKDGLAFVNIGAAVTSNKSKGNYVINVRSLLQSSDATYHAILIECTEGTQVQNVWTTYGIYGLVIKAFNTAVNGWIGEGHANESLIVKSDQYSLCSGLVASNLSWGPVAGGDCGPLMIQQGDSFLLGPTTLSNIRQQGSAYALKLNRTGGEIPFSSPINIIGYVSDAPTEWTGDPFKNDNISVNGLNVNAIMARANLESILFNGMTSGLVFPSNPSRVIGTGAGTLATWVSFEVGIGNTEMIIGGAMNSLEIFRTSTGAIEVLKAGSGTVVSTSDLSWTPRQWYHIATVINNFTAKIYRNGIEAVSVSFAGDLSGETNSLGIQSFDSNYRLNGQISGSVMYQRGISPLEVAELMQTGRTIDATSLVWAPDFSNANRFGLADPVSAVSITVGAGHTVLPECQVATALKLQNSATINGIGFDGSSNVLIPSKTPPVTVSALPVSPVSGDWSAVTDALAPAYGLTVVGGGSVVTPVFFNGTNWTCR